MSYWKAIREPGFSLFKIKSNDRMNGNNNNINIYVAPIGESAGSVENNGVLVKNCSTGRMLAARNSMKPVREI